MEVNLELLIDWGLKSVNRIRIFRIAIQPRRQTVPDQNRAEGLDMYIPDHIGIHLVCQTHGILLWSNQWDSFCSAGEEFAPSLKPCAVTGAVNITKMCLFFAPKNEIGLENDYAQIVLKGSEIWWHQHHIVWYDHGERASFTPSRLLSGHLFK